MNVDSKVYTTFRCDCGMRLECEEFYKHMEYHSIVKFLLDKRKEV
ncbi:hypothetical protein AXI71_gp17 [Lactococcus phage GE1]|uniref:Uncharacterized protein n=1 Tax=Lactococcus phage GE1 TaxID=1698369 RepID=A0A0N7E0N4_9CAUD|nr:hypothetical protein AXI71_gp17 [Lactococcus phage GE1]ALA06971.1 hypothetical protein [Lactococcus phage GE1]